MKEGLKLIFTSIFIGLGIYIIISLLTILIKEMLF